MKCLYCESKNIKKNGKFNGKQRYRCKDCGKTWSESHKCADFSKTETRQLSLLLNLIDEIIDNKVILRNSKVAPQLFKERSRINKKQIQFHDIKISGDIEIDCYKPTLLICQDGDLIDIYRIPKGNLIECAAEEDESKSQRIITIKDSVKNKSCKIFTVDEI